LGSSQIPLAILDLPVTWLPSGVDLLVVQVTRYYRPILHRGCQNGREQLAGVLVLTLRNKTLSVRDSLVLYIYQLLVVLQLFLAPVQVLQIPRILEVWAWHPVAVLSSALVVVV